MKVSLVGVGGLGGALARGWLAHGLAPQNLTLFDVDSARARRAVEGTPCRTVDSAQDAATGAEVVVVAVKPGDVVPLLRQMAPHMGAQATLVSVAAGITLAQLRQGLGGTVHLVRAMPNVNVAVAQSCTALCSEPSTTPDARRAVEELWSAVGTAVWLPQESMMDAATALGASGPAWVAVLLEALMDGGVKAGLPRAVARDMALAMVQGTVGHLTQKDLHPGALKDMVTSPAGTTAAGQLVLEQAGVRGALMGAVDAATQRAAALSRN